MWSVARKIMMAQRMRLFVVLPILCLSACGLLPEEIDKTADWSASRLYTEAKSAFNDGNWEQAIKYYRRLESRYPYGRYAQQAQMESAYANWKDGDAAAPAQPENSFIPTTMIP